jgi:RimJ/RimL family protein N-acetyltransferase
LATERVRIRPLEPDDAPALAAYRDDPAVARFQGWATPYTLDSALRLIREVGQLELGDAGWVQRGVELRETGALIGDVGLNRFATRRVEVGYTLARSAWGNGYATEAVGALVEHALGPLRMTHVFAGVDPANTASIAVLLRLGFTLDGRLDDGDDRYVLTAVR